MKSTNNSFTLTLFLLSIIFWSCSENRSSSNEIEITESIIEFPITERELNYYVQSTYYSNEQSQNMFVGYNHIHHSFDFFDLDQKQLVQVVQLDKEGPNGVARVGAFSVSPDRIITKSPQQLYIINFQGEVLDRLVFSTSNSTDMKNGLAGIDWDQYSLHPSKVSFHGTEISYLPYNSEEQEIFLPLYKAGLRSSDNFYDNSTTIVNIDLSQRKAIPLSVSYPNIFKEGFYGDLDHPFIQKVGAKLVYNYPNSSLVYTYDLNSEEFTQTAVNSTITANQSKTTTLKEYEDTQQRVKYAFHNVQFYGVHHDKFNDLYYRVHQDAVEDIPQRKENHYFMIFDKDFSVKKEVRLEPSYSLNYFPTQQGVFFPIKDRKQDCLSFGVVSIVR